MSVYEFRHTTGRYLYEQHPVEADIVIGVPDSGVPAAIGYAEASGIPYSAGLLKINMWDVLSLLLCKNYENVLSK